MTVVGNDISMPRGDSESITVRCSSGGISVPFMPGDTVYFTVKTSINTETKLFQKVITTFDDGRAIIPILPADTKTLRFGVYVYDVQLVTAAGVVTTIIHPSQFTLTGEVTYE